MLDLQRPPREGRDLRALRAYHGIPQGHLARCLGVTRQRVQQIEYARRPTASAVERYMAALARATEER